MKLFSKKWYGLIMGLTLLISSCSYTDDINSLSNRISDLESAVFDLQEAFRAGKIISSVDPVTNAEEGYMITFSDGSTILLKHGKDGADGKDGVDGKDGADGKDGVDGKDGADGKDGVDGKDGITPIVKIDNDGNWVVSYDNKESFQQLYDENNEPIKAIGETGATGICVRVVEENGFYVFQLYSPDEPEIILDTISTPYSVNPANVLSSIVEDSNSGVITLTMGDGTAFCFNLDVTYPTSIILLSDHLELTKGTTSTTFEFRLNPSNAFINWIYDGESPNIQLDKIATSRAGDADSYVTVPGHYKITDIVPSVNEDGNRKIGQYTVTVESTGINVGGEDVVALVVTTKDGKGKKIQLTSSLMSIAYDTRPQIYSLNVGGVEAIRANSDDFYVKLSYGVNPENLSLEYESNAEISINGVSSPTTVNLSKPVEVEANFSGVKKSYNIIGFYSEMPIIYVETPSPIISKEEWIKNSSIKVFNAGEFDAVYLDVQMKGRGNSTWGQPKKPYAIKLDKKAEMLGMPKHKRWVLLANYIDKSNLRTEASMYLGRKSSLEYTPRTKFVEVVLNGEYLGLYQLTEQLKIDDNRVNVGEDGFLMEIDVRAGEDPDDVYFRVEDIPRPVVIKDPDITYESEEMKFLKDYLSSVSAAIRKIRTDSNSTEFEDYIDLDSFVDWYLINEITRNNDACFWASCYMNLKRDGKLKMGPLWDFDLSIGNTQYNDSDKPIGFWLKETIPWYISLFESKIFVDKLKSRFNQIYNTRFGWYEYIRLQREYIRYPNFGNALKWQLWDVGNQTAINNEYDNEVENMIGWLETRLQWMNTEFNKL